MLDALSQHPFEALEVVGLKFLSLKTALLLTLTTAKRLSDLQVLSTHPACLRFVPGLSKVCLRTNPVLPKVVEPACRCPTVELKAFHPLPFGCKLNCYQTLNCADDYLQWDCDRVVASFPTGHQVLTKVLTYRVSCASFRLRSLKLG